MERSDWHWIKILHHSWNTRFGIFIFKLLMALVVLALISQMCIRDRAYPVVVFTKQLEDRSRKIMEIIEGEDYLDGKLLYRSLYKYEVVDTVTLEGGEKMCIRDSRRIPQGCGENGKGHGCGVFSHRKAHRDAACAGGKNNN